MEKERIRTLPPAGVYTARWIPYGYQYDPDSINLVKIDAEVANHVRFIFQMYLDGVSIKEICRRLDERGAPNPPARREQLGDKSSAKKAADHWNPVSLNQMFFNPMYVGDWILSGKLWDAVYLYSGKPTPDGTSLPVVEKNHHEALISREDMKQASLLFLKNRAEHNKKQKPAKHRAVSDSLGQLLRCGECGRTMSKSELLAGDGSRQTVYSCSSFYLRQSCKCAGYFYRLDDLSAAIVPPLLSERKDAIKCRKMIEQGKGSSYARMEKSLQSQIDQAVDCVRKNLTAGQKLKSSVHAKGMTEEELQASQMQIAEENRIAEQQVMKALLQLRSFRNSCTTENPWLSLYSELPETIDLSDDLDTVIRVIERIDCFPDQPSAVRLLYMGEKDALQQILTSNTRTRRTSSEKGSKKASAAESQKES